MKYFKTFFQLSSPVNARVWNVKKSVYFQSNIKVSKFIAGTLGRKQKRIKRSSRFWMRKWERNPGVGVPRVRWRPDFWTFRGPRRPLFFGRLPDRRQERHRNPRVPIHFCTIQQGDRDLRVGRLLLLVSCHCTIWKKMGHNLNDFSIFGNTINKK